MRQNYFSGSQNTQKVVITFSESKSYASVCTQISVVHCVVLRRLNMKESQLRLLSLKLLTSKNKESAIISTNVYHMCNKISRTGHNELKHL